ncbi:MAG: hypothetical protein J6J45_02085, partial [Clostridia bacterium]|nr:hypothetical protein [Clostridia bacterium]
FLRSSHILALPVSFPVPWNRAHTFRWIHPFLREVDFGNAERRRVAEQSFIWLTAINNASQFVL